MSKAWVVDLWTKLDPQTKKRVKSARNGVGSRWRVDWYDDTTAKRSLKSKSFRSKSLAEDFRASIENDIRAGTYRPLADTKKKFDLVADQWLDSKKKIKESSRHNYERDLRMYARPQWGHRAIGSIERHEVEAWISELQTGAAKSDFKRDMIAERKGLSPSSIDRLHYVTSAVLGYAVKAGWIATNPAAGVELPQSETSEQVYLNFDEVEALADAAGTVGDEKDKVLVHLLAYSGLRINEALALTVDDIDTAERRITVRKTWTLDAAGGRKLGQPKTGERRSVPLVGFLVDDLNILLNGRTGSDYVFRNASGGPIHDHNWRPRVWSRAVQSAGLDDLGITPHKLRHTAASIAIAAGADVKLVQRMLGHRDATETLNTYGHLWPDKLNEVTEAMESARAKALDKSSRIPHHE